MSPGVSYDNTDHPPITVINDLLQCILQFLLALIGHLGDLGLDAVFYDLFNGFAEDIGIQMPSSLSLELDFMYAIRSFACCSLPTIGAISVSIWARIRFTEGAWAFIFTPYLFP